MAKKLLSVIVLAAAAVSGCGKAGPGPGPTAAAATSEKAKSERQFRAVDPVPIPVTPSTKSPPPTPVAPEARQLTLALVSEIHATFSDNQHVAKKKYGLQRWRTTGDVREIGDEDTIQVSDPNGFGMTEIQLKPGIIESVHRGQMITVEGSLKEVGTSFGPLGGSSARLSDGEVVSPFRPK